MKKLFYLSALVLVLVSCGREITGQEVLTLNTLQSSAMSSFKESFEHRSVLKEICEDKSSPIRQERAIKTLKSFNEIDSLVGSVVSELDKIKSEIFSEIGISLRKSKDWGNYFVYDSAYNLSPYCFKFEKIRTIGSTDVLLTRKKEIIKLCSDFRKNIMQLFVASENRVLTSSEVKRAFFKDPEISNYDDIRDLNRRIAKAIDSSNVFFDEQFVFEDVYRILTKSNQEWNNILTESESWVDAVSVLLSIELTIFEAKLKIDDALKFRLSHCCSVFDQILPVANAPQAAEVGDTIKFDLFMSAFDEERAPEVFDLKNFEVYAFENGIAKCRAVIPNKAFVEFSGVLGTTNYGGGIWKTPWSHKVKILPKPTQK